MAGTRQPTRVILANGRKHFTKEEIEERLNAEVQPCTDDISAPAYLSAAEKRHFKKLADQLDKLGILGETDVETLARYVTAQAQYEKVTKELRALINKKPKEKDFESPVLYADALASWVGVQTDLAKLQDRYFKQAHTAATALGLTISARCKLVVPKAEEEPKVNKFAKFGAG